MISVAIRVRDALHPHPVVLTSLHYRFCRACMMTYDVFHGERCPNEVLLEYPWRP